MKTEEKIKEILKSNIKFRGTITNGNYSCIGIPYENALNAIREISSLIPRWRKVGEELPDKTGYAIIAFYSKMCRKFLSKKVWYDFENKKWETKFEVKYWMPESELLNLIPK